MTSTSQNRCTNMTSRVLRAWDSLRRFFRLRWHRHSSALGFIAVGAVLCFAYSWNIGAYLTSLGVSAPLLKFAPLFGPSLAAIIFLLQVNRARYSQRIDLIVKMAERFDKQEMKVTRARAAKALLLDRNTQDDTVSQVL